MMCLLRSDEEANKSKHDLAPTPVPGSSALDATVRAVEDRCGITSDLGKHHHLDDAAHARQFAAPAGNKNPGALGGHAPQRRFAVCKSLLVDEALLHMARVESKPCNWLCVSWCCIQVCVCVACSMLMLSVVRA